MTYEKIDNESFKRTVTSEVVVNIKDLREQLRLLRQARQDDKEAETLRDFVISELEKTSLDGDTKFKLVQAVTYAPSGVTKSMIDNLKAEIDELLLLK